MWAHWLEIVQVKSSCHLAYVADECQAVYRALLLQRVVSAVSTFSVLWYFEGAQATEQGMLTCDHLINTVEAVQRVPGPRPGIMLRELGSHAQIQSRHASGSKS